MDSLKSLCAKAGLLPLLGLILASLASGVTSACGDAAPEPIATPVPVLTPVTMETPVPGLMPFQVATPISIITPLPALATAMPAVAEPAESLIRLVDPLDEPEFYCVDVVGFRDSLKLDRPLQAHTCKPGAEDELFSFNELFPGQIYMRAYDLCVEAGDKLLYLEPCAQSPLQRFSHATDGSIQPAGGQLCLAVAGDSGERAGGRSHLRRDLRLSPCGEVEPARLRWLLPGPRP
jgi:hypothetical protein